MSFADYTDEQIDRVDKGLSLLGWGVYWAVTSDDASMLSDIASQAISMADSGTLEDEKIEALSLQAYRILGPHIMKPDTRIYMMGLYTEVSRATGILSLLDEATMAFYRGYHTSSLATLFVALEAYLRCVRGWKPGDKNLSYPDLVNTVEGFPDSDTKQRVLGILKGLYSHYDPLQPTRFLFNRHGLLHGLRVGDETDEMNCARMFYLFDLLMALEDDMPAGVIVDGETGLRRDAYWDCLDEAHTGSALLRRYR